MRFFFKKNSRASIAGIAELESFLYQRRYLLVKLPTWCSFTFVLKVKFREMSSLSRFSRAAPCAAALEPGDAARLLRPARVQVCDIAEHGKLGSSTWPRASTWQGVSDSITVRFPLSPCRHCFPHFPSTLCHRFSPLIRPAVLDDVFILGEYRVEERRCGVRMPNAVHYCNIHGMEGSYVQEKHQLHCIAVKMLHPTIWKPQVNLSNPTISFPYATRMNTRKPIHIVTRAYKKYHHLT